MTKIAIYLMNNFYLTTMKKQILIISIVLAGIVSVYGQNYMGMSQSKIIKRLGEPDERGENYLVYSDPNEDGKNIYYFDENETCSSFILIRDNTYYQNYQKILNKEFTKTSENKYQKKSKKINFQAEITKSRDVFQIRIQNNTANSTMN